jgi:type I restriction enzyme, S subunit
MSQIASEKDVNYKQEPHTLPNGWSWTPLGEICNAINGRAFKSTEWRDSGVPIIRIQNLKDSDALFNYFQGELDERNKVRAGDLLFAWSGTPGTSFGAHIWRGQNAALNQHIFNVQFDRSKIDTKYFCYALNQNVSRYVAQAQGGVGLAHITKGKFMASKVPLAPLDQQKHIVAEIEKQFSRLDEAVANLKRVKANLKRYKAAVLKAAVEGRLVEPEAAIARREGRSYETGAQLLQRILDTRRSEWRGKGRYKEPAVPDTTDLPELPEGWFYATAEQLTDENRAITYGVIKLGEPVDGGVPVLRSSDVRQLRIDLDDVKRISPEIAKDYRRTFLKGGEVVMTVRGTLGGIAVVPPQCNGFNVSREVAMLALVEPQIAQLVAHFIASAPLENWLIRRTKGIAYTGINIETLKALPIPIPPLNEQHRLVAEIDRRLSLSQGVDITTQRNLSRASHTYQGVLQRAFTGWLSQCRGPTISGVSA